MTSARVWSTCKVSPGDRLMNKNRTCSRDELLGQVSSLLTSSSHDMGDYFMRDTEGVVIRILSLINMSLGHFLGICLLPNSPEAHMTEDITFASAKLHENQDSMFHSDSFCKPRTCH